MQPYQQRVVDEAEALRDKHHKLAIFMGRPTFHLQSDLAQEQMSYQFEHMSKYLDVLDDRILGFAGYPADG